MATNKLDVVDLDVDLVDVDLDPDLVDVDLDDVDLVDVDLADNGLVDVELTLTLTECIKSVLDFLVLKNAAECTSQRLKWILEPGLCSYFMHDSCPARLMFHDHPNCWHAK